MSFVETYALFVINVKAKIAMADFMLNNIISSPNLNIYYMFILYNKNIQLARIRGFQC